MRKQSNIRDAKYEKNIGKIDGKSMTPHRGHYRTIECRSLLGPHFPPSCFELMLLSVKLSAFRGHAHAQFTDNICGGVCCHPHPRQNPFTPKRRHSGPTRNRNQRGGFRRVKEVSLQAKKHFLNLFDVFLPFVERCLF